ncbi:hypothetical protein FQN54_004973 [Arachnomyces sp. PD_36]|nr:hypothetical protein FQN54_004973 [Arachnomyces sp. PD_36]
MAAPPTLNGDAGFDSALSFIQSGSTEEVVQMVWNIITVTWFPSRQGFKWGFKSQSLQNDNAPDVIVFQINMANPNPNAPQADELMIMQIECKRPSQDTPAGWAGALEGQVLDDLSTSGNPSDRLYGALAIGTKVMFYRFDGSAQQKITHLHPGKLDLTKPADRTQIEAWMTYVKQNGWQWAM